MRKSCRSPSHLQGSVGPGGPCSDMNFRLRGLFRSVGLIQTLDCRAEPFSQGRFQFLTSPTTIKRIYGFALIIQGYVAAGDISATQARRHKLVEDALTARPGRLSRIRIQAGWRVLEDELRAPSRKVGITVTAFLDEFELGFEHCEKIAFIFPHRRVPTRSQVRSDRGGAQ